MAKKTDTTPTTITSNGPTTIRNAADLNKALGKKSKPTVKKVDSKKDTGKKAPATKKEVKKTTTKKQPLPKVGGNAVFGGFKEKTKLATIYFGLKASKYTMKELIAHVQSMHKDDPAQASKVTCYVQVSHYKNGKYGYKLSKDEKTGILSIA